MFRLAAQRAVLRGSGTCSKSLYSSSALVQALQTKFDLPASTKFGDEWGIDGNWEPRLTKIVATIGPTSEQLPVLQEVRVSDVCSLMTIEGSRPCLTSCTPSERGNTGGQERHAHYAIKL